MNITPLVAIKCMTYNHAPYITDAMNGFCMQRTTFPYVAIIVDDASTDGEPCVIQDYLNNHFDMSKARRWETDDAFFIEAQHHENKNCWFAVVLLKYNFYQIKKNKKPLIAEWQTPSIYIAMCEGDDYWINSNKLQFQVSYLENHLDYSMCYSGFRTVDDKGNYIERHNYEKAMKMSKSGDILSDLLVTNFILTCTAIYRSCVITQFNKMNFKYKYDYSLFLFAATKGKCYYTPQKLSAYRRTPTGAMSTMQDRITIWFHETRLFFYNGVLDGSIPTYQNSHSYRLLNTIAKYCYFEDNPDYIPKYKNIIKKHIILWPFVLPLFSKKLLQLWLK